MGAAKAVFSNDHQILAALADALGSDPFYAAIFRDFTAPPARRAAMLSYFDYAMTEAARIGRCVPAPDSLGAAIWVLPGAEDAAEEKEEFLKTVLGPKGMEDYRRIVAFMGERSEEAVPAGSWYLSIVGVSPAGQGRGLGAKLLAPTLAEADAAGAVCHLETFAPRSLPFYRRLGFEEVMRVREPVTGAEYGIMRRTPR
ncbi:MAG: GNAT family N-acetyltransferase [Elusimicrobia bacterium]|nr:GNAT family N-acetyltransferase [Elusimicrobiota bacterium]